MLQVVFEKEGWRWVTDTDGPVEACTFCTDQRTARVRVNVGQYIVRLCRVHRPKGKRDAQHIGIRIRATLAQGRKVTPAAPVSKQLVLL